MGGGGGSAASVLVGKAQQLAYRTQVRTYKRVCGGVCHGPGCVWGGGAWVCHGWPGTANYVSKRPRTQVQRGGAGAVLRFSFSKLLHHSGVLANPKLIVILLEAKPGVGVGRVWGGGRRADGSAGGPSLIFSTHAARPGRAWACSFGLPHRASPQGLGPQGFRNSGFRG
jgi:hypothetical protein